MNGAPRNRPPLSPREAWISDGRQVLHFKLLRYSRWRQALEVTFGEVVAAGEPPLLKRRRQLTRQQAIKLWADKRLKGWLPTTAQWKPPASAALV